MKKIVILLSFTLLSFFTISAQEKNKKSREKIKALKVSFLTEQLSLTKKEAEKFWPVYNAHDNKYNKFIRNQLIEVKREIYKAGGIDNISDKRAKELFNVMRLYEKKKHEEYEKFITNLENILPVKKIIKLQIAEREFGRKLMRRYKHKDKKLKKK